jgi:hypothetical protein
MSMGGAADDCEGDGDSLDDPPPIAGVLALADRYRLRAHRQARGQYLAAKRASAMHARLGIPVVILSTAAGGSTFATLNSAPEIEWIVATGTISLVAAAMAALQTFFGFADRAEKHRAAGGQFAGLKIDLDLLMLKAGLKGVGAGHAVSALESAAAKFTRLQSESPDIPDRFYDQARREQESDHEGV